MKYDAGAHDMADDYFEGTGRLLIDAVSGCLSSPTAWNPLANHLRQLATPSSGEPHTPMAQPRPETPSTRTGSPFSPVATRSGSRVEYRAQQLHQASSGTKAFSSPIRHFLPVC
jgi:hypothetical protein